MTIGCGTMAQGDSLEACIERADNNMYRDKLTKKMHMRRQGGLLIREDVAEVFGKLM